MVQFFVVLFVAIPLAKLLFLIAWPSLLERTEANRATAILTKNFGQPYADPIVDAIGERLLENSSLKAQFAVLPGSQRNAVCLPNGQIYVWQGLIEETHGDRDMLAGALAHELGHLAHNHFLERIQWTAIARFVLGFAGGSWMRRMLHKTIATIVARGFSRGHELQADEAAVAMLIAANFDPEGLIRLLDRLAMTNTPKGNQLFGTHPEPRSRADRLRKLLSLTPECDDEPKDNIIRFPHNSHSN